MAKTPVSQRVLLSGVSTPSAGQSVDLAEHANEQRNYVAHVSGTGAVSATILVEVSNNNLHFIPLATITLSGTNSATDGFVSDESWQYVRGRLSAVTGSGATVTLTMGY